MSEFWITASHIFQFILGITILIALHELGHFFIARFFKVEAEEIGLGLPPRIVYLGKFLGTPFSINWLPLGAFVRLKDEAGTTGEQGGLFSIAPIKRSAIFFAGPATNILVALILLTVVAAALGAPDNSRLVIASVAEGSPGYSAGLQPQDVITAVDGQAFAKYEEFHDNIRSRLGKEIVLTVSRGSDALSFAVTPRESWPDDQGPLGISVHAGTRPTTIGEAAISSIESFKGYTITFFSLLGDMLLGKAGPSGQLVGFKGMFDLYAYTQGEDVTRAIPGWISAINFFAMISMSLGLANLIPLPALDGGRILFTLPELLFRIKIPRKVETAFNAASLVLLIILMLYVNLRDIIAPLQLPVL